MKAKRLAVALGLTWLCSPGVGLAWHDNIWIAVSSGLICWIIAWIIVPRPPA